MTVCCVSQSSLAHCIKLTAEAAQKSLLHLDRFTASGEGKLEELE